MLVRSRNRQPSNMQSSITYFHRSRLDDMAATKSTFGTTYKMSNTTKTLDHSNPLISNRTNPKNGYVSFDKYYSQLPFQSSVPEGFKIYTLTDNLTPVAVTTTVPANQPLLVEGQGVVTFLGTGEVSYSACPLTDEVLPITTTAISSVHHTSGDQPRYNLHGQRVDASHRGVVIRSGKKYTVK